MKFGRLAHDTTVRHRAPPSFHRFRVTAAYLLGLYALSSCNVIVDTGTDQCQVHRECQAKAGVDNAPGAFCNAHHVCEVARCTTTPECSALLGEPSYCRPDRTCARLLTDKCFDVYPPDALTQPDLVLFGFMAPLRNEADSGYGTPLMEGVELALFEIEQNNHGIPSITGAATRTPRHLGMLVCEHGNRAEKEHIETARHLIKDVGVPAIVGPAFSGFTLDVFDDVAYPNHTLVLSPSATSPVISGRTDDDNLLWRTAPSDVEQAETLKWLVAEIKHALPNASTPVAAPIVAMTVKQDPAGLGLQAAATTSNLAIDDESKRAPPMLPDVPAIIYPDQATSEQYAQAYNALMANPPNIVVALGTDEFVRELLPRIESDWEQRGNGMPRPWYLLPEGDRTDALLKFATDPLNARYRIDQRVLGTAPGARRYPGFQGFSARFASLFQHPPGNLAEFAYDAAYLLAYSIVYTGVAHPTG
ncbi:MAG TPA: hypothetical protein VIV60_27575, partial [Polyangiaceae bacterium]